MTSTAGTGSEDDPRKARSRRRLLTAAAELLRDGGLDAVTIDAVTRRSGVARTTLYRHFDTVAQLRTATLEELMPPVVEIPDAGPLRERLIELLTRQAAAINDVPLHLTTLAWLATGDAQAHGEGVRAGSLRTHLIDTYRRPFDELFDDPRARALLGDRELTAVLAQLVGPIVFVRLTGIGRAGRDDCARIVDDFLAACERDRD
ncbi:TetR/AcrR family transcriptional regulator [Nocardia sp. AB354]|uniref:TetR/AcrR family transcriptional regulator n=1 Tax=Nocardia sp. AB354 TaxID=3413283 RepID=UPI003C277521